MTVPLFVWLYVVFSLAPRIVQSYLFNLSGSAARCFNLYRFAVRAVRYTMKKQHGHDNNLNEVMTTEHCRPTSNDIAHQEEEEEEEE